ncbi:poly(U)-specific endoribonuclease-B-like [Gymnogyps californianus]|uniref:poly(U)-specific endoribonuclease-B-like n=1 Tax=Gymnogyps californianus TaxID=33616 RepID=UPI0021CA79FF|nr:poly(U)-specific endoribonuclease-B-like [Gymnogyps californianus]
MADGKSVNHELSKLFNEMWDMDVNRLMPGKDYTIDLQGKAGVAHQGDSGVQDSAARHLFHNVNEEHLKSIKTFATFISLLDNYETSTGIAEVVTPEEIVENNCFLDAILATEVMKLAHEYLLKKKLAKPNLADFKYQLYDIWFQLYARKEGDRPDSCGFEHVFVGETRRGKQILGLHNWVQFYLQEKRNQIDYKGYVARKNKTRPDKDDQVLSIQFSWKGSVKPIGSTFIGVSPEFEFALYTIIFLLAEERVTRETVKIEEYELQIVVCRHGNHIGTAYPVLLSTSSEDELLE